MSTFSDYLNTPVNGFLTVVASAWVKLTNNDTAVNYISTGASDPSTGKFTVNNIPPGTYTVYTGPANIGPWTAAADTNFVVPLAPSVAGSTVGVFINSSGDVAARSLTVSSNSPNTNTAVAGGANFSAAVKFASGSPWFDITHPTFGADPTGTADSTTAIQTAITAAAVAGGIVFCPPGSYRTTAVLVIPNNQTTAIRLVGAGKGVSSIFQITASTAVLQVGTNSRFDVTDMTLSVPASGSTGSIIIGGSANTQGWNYGVLANLRLLNADSTHWAIQLTNPFSLTLHDLEIRNCGNGIDFINNSTTVNYGNSRLDHIEVVLVAGVAGVALQFESTNAQTKIMNLNTVTRLDVTVASGAAGYATGSAAIYLNGADHNYFFGCDSEFTDHGIRLVNSLNNRFVGFYLNASGETTGVINNDANSTGNNFDRFLLTKITGASNNVCLQDSNASTTKVNSFTLVESPDNWTTLLSVNNNTRLWAVMLNNVLQTNVAINSWRELTVKNQGAGSDPKFSSNSGAQNLDFTGSLRPATDNVGTLGDSSHRWNLMFAVVYRVFTASGDANPSAALSVGQVAFGAGGASALDRTLARSATGWNMTGGPLSLDNKVFPGTDAGSAQTTAGIYGGSGVPSNANGNNGDYYFRSDTPGTGNQRIYVKSAGVWVGVV